MGGVAHVQLPTTGRLDTSDGDGDGGSWSDPGRLYRMFDLDGEAAAFGAENPPADRKPGVAMAQVLVASAASGDGGQREQQAAIGLHVVAALLVRALSRGMRRDHTCSATVADTLMRQLCHHAPASALAGGDGRHVLSKTFDEGPDGVECHISELGDDSPYFLRPRQDRAIRKGHYTAAESSLEPFALEDVLVQSRARPPARTHLPRAPDPAVRERQDRRESKRVRGNVCVCVCVCL